MTIAPKSPLKVKRPEPMDPYESASNAARWCYTSKPPKPGRLINVRKGLFDVSHHTTLQQAESYFSFEIDTISVADITLGLHLVSPFYDSDQRSGRYAGLMFTEPNFFSMMRYIDYYWPNQEDNTLRAISEYLQLGVQYYREGMQEGPEIAAGLLKTERPYISDAILERNAPKVAQEQMRMFIPAVFPTGLVFTINLTALAAMYEEAWTPALKELTTKMAALVVFEHPRVSFMFNEGRRKQREWAIPIPSNDVKIGVRTEPYLKNFTARNTHLFVEPDSSDMFPVDRTHFSPELMDNSVASMRMTVGMSLATMGQDQRHRTLRRGTPRFIGDFYLPPIPTESKHAAKYFAAAEDLMRSWKDISKMVPPTLGMVLAPYGAMVEYTKEGSLNAIAHEQFKRECWCAQEEIYWLGVLERKAVRRRCGEGSRLLSIFQPPCYRNGKCAEGDRYCGRDISVRNTGDYFPQRKV